MKKWGGHLVNIVLICILSGLFSTATIIQGSGWFGMRCVYPLASIMGCLIINFYVNIEIGFKGCSKIAKMRNEIVWFAMMIVLVSQYLSFGKIYLDIYRLNYADKLRANYIGQSIVEYQENTGITITKIAFYEDANKESPTYPDLDSDLIASSFNTEWSNIRAINYYLGTEYERIDSNEDYIVYFANYDWNRLSKEQLIFDNDILHLCIY